MHQKVDYLVVGGGILGVMTARAIVTMDGSARVLIVDRAEIGGGATRRSAGMSFPFGRDAEARTLSDFSEDAYAALTAEHPDLPIRTVSHVGLVSKDAIHYLFERFSRAPVSLTTLAPAAPAFLTINDPTTRLFSLSGCHYTFPATIAERIALDLRCSGYVNIWENVEVIELVEQPGSVTARLSNGRVVSTRAAILAPGPWVNARCFHPFTARLDVRVKKVVAFHIDRVPKESDPLIFFHDEDAFLLPVIERGHWVFSVTSKHWDIDPDGAPFTISDDDWKVGQRILQEYAPSLLPYCLSARVYCDAYNTNGAPIISPVSDIGRIIFAGAASGSGYRLAPGVAERAARHAVAFRRTERMEAIQ